MFYLTLRGLTSTTATRVEWIRMVTSTATTLWAGPTVKNNSPGILLNFGNGYDGFYIDSDGGNRYGDPMDYGVRYSYGIILT